MDAISHVMFRKVIKHTMNKVNDTHEPILIMQPSGQNVVLMTLQDFQDYEAFQSARELAARWPNYRFSSDTFRYSENR